MTPAQIQLINDTYKGKRVFLTGHTGFKGSWLLYWLNELGAEVKGYALAPHAEQDLYHQIRGDDFCSSVIADIRDRSKLTKELLSFRPDFVFHLAAQPLVRRSYEIPGETFEVNAMGTANVLDALRGLDMSCVGVMVTTDKVYENKEWHYPYRECDRLGGYDPYSASKACAELIIDSYRNSFFHPHSYGKHFKTISSARAGNVIGGGDWAKDRIVPDIVRALQKGEPVIVRNPKAVRPWQHVLEPLGGYLLLGAKMASDPVKYASSWNFGPLSEDNLSVEELVKTALEIWGKGTYQSERSRHAPHEAGLLKLDISKATSELSWRPKWNSNKAICETIKFYKSAFTSIPAVDALGEALRDYQYD